ncbi:hypothetical protein N9W31_00725 [Litoricolaceae bacterium]|nr:hypothetical protein [Litorivicinaceae bacterium]
MILALLSLSPMIISPNNYRQNIAIVIVSLIYWFYQTRGLSRWISSLWIVVTSITWHFSVAPAVVPLLLDRFKQLIPIAICLSIFLSMFGIYLIEIVPYDFRKFTYLLEPRFAPQVLIDDIFDFCICFGLWIMSARNPLLLKIAFFGLCIEISFLYLPEFASRMGVVFEFAETFLVYIFLRDYAESKNSLGKILVCLLLGESMLKIFLI